MSRDLGQRPYFRITLVDLSGLADLDTVILVLPEGRLIIPVSVLRARFSDSKNWLDRGYHSSSKFPKWLQDYLR